MRPDRRWLRVTAVLLALALLRFGVALWSRLHRPAAGPAAAGRGAAPTPAPRGRRATREPEPFPPDPFSAMDGDR